MGFINQLLALFRKKDTPSQFDDDFVRDRRLLPRVNPAPGTRILVIDDSPTIITAMQRFLEPAQCVFMGAQDAKRGIERALTQSPDLIFLDIVMPGINGFAVLRALRKSARTRDIPIIMMSGNEQAKTQFFGTHIGADDFMKKPFSRFDVFNRISGLLDENFVPRRNSVADEDAPEAVAHAPSATLPTAQPANTAPEEVPADGPLLVESVEPAAQNARVSNSIPEIPSFENPAATGLPDYTPPAPEAQSDPQPDPDDTLPIATDAVEVPQAVAAEAPVVTVTPPATRPAPTIRFVQGVTVPSIPNREPPRLLSTTPIPEPDILDQKAIAIDVIAPELPPEPILEVPVSAPAAVQVESAPGTSTTDANIAANIATPALKPASAQVVQLTSPAEEAPSGNAVPPELLTRIARLAQLAQTDPEALKALGVLAAQLLEQLTPNKPKRASASAKMSKIKAKAKARSK